MPMAPRYGLRPGGVQQMLICSQIEALSRPAALASVARPSEDADQQGCFKTMICMRQRHRNRTRSLT